MKKLIMGHRRRLLFMKEFIYETSKREVSIFFFQFFLPFFSPCASFLSSRIFDTADFASGFFTGPATSLPKTGPILFTILPFSTLYQFPRLNLSVGEEMKERENHPKLPKLLTHVGGVSSRVRVEALLGL